MNIPINFYHQKGHVDLNKQKLLDKAYEDFKITNNIKDDVDMDIIKCISFYNDIVDVDTKDTLSNYISRNERKDYLDTRRPIIFSPKIEQKSVYKKLINNKR